jgi:hypothetical protein
LEDGPAAEALDSYFGGQSGQAEMLRATGIHLTLAGEAYHLGTADGDWSVLATGRVTQSGTGAKSKITADYGDGEKFNVTDKDVLIRVWNPHPVNPFQADSPVKANLSTLSEITSCNLHVQATLVSRLAGAGVLFLPQDISFPVPEGMDPSASTADVFMSVLGEAMTTPIGEPGDASAVVPIVVQAPGESLSQVRHVTFWTEVSEQVRLMRDSAVKRLALGMDIPPEVLMGIADTNHWNAWLVDESSVKAHTEPRLAVVANAITTAFLRPALEGVVADPKRFAVVADTSNIRLRPNRSREAIELYDRGELAPDALRRETGFEPEDTPTDHEFREWLLKKIALGSTSPEQTQAALDALGAGVKVIPGDLGPAKGRPDMISDERTLDQHPERNIPEEDESLLAACDVLVYRALERAGNRLKSKHSYAGKTPAADLYREFDGVPADVLLADAWTCVPTVVRNAPPGLPLALDSYARSLIATRQPHTREALAAALRAHSAAV